MVSNCDALLSVLCQSYRLPLQQVLAVLSHNLARVSCVIMLQVSTNFSHYHRPWKRQRFRIYFHHGVRYRSWSIQIIVSRQSWGYGEARPTSSSFESSFKLWWYNSGSLYHIYPYSNLVVLLVNLPISAHSGFVSDCSRQMNHRVFGPGTSISSAPLRKPFGRALGLSNHPYTRIVIDSVNAASSIIHKLLFYAGSFFGSRQRVEDEAHGLESTGATIFYNEPNCTKTRTFVWSCKNLPGNHLATKKIVRYCS